MARRHPARRPARRGDGRATWSSPRYAAEHEWAADARIRDVARRASACRRPARSLDSVIDRLSGGERRRVALAAALLAAISTCSCSTSPPTTSTSRASAGWPSTSWRGAARSSSSPTTGGSSTPVAPARGRSRRQGREYEGGYTDWVFARAERARQADAAESAAAEPRPQGAGLAAARAARAHVQAALPHRGRRGVDRRRAAAARQGRAARVRHAPARPHRLRAGGRHRRGRRGARCSTASRGGSGPATGSASSGSTARARPPCCARSPGDAAARRRTGGARQRPCSSRSCRRSSSTCRGRLRVLEAVEAVAKRVDVGEAGATASVRCWSGSGSPRRGSGRRSGSSPAASADGCSSPGS